MIIELLTNIPALLSGLAALVALFWGWGNGKLQRRWGRKEGRQDVADEMDDAYNKTVKEWRDEKTDLPSNPVDVLDSLREFAERGKGGGDT